jgi:hypothetical protein
MDRAWRPTKRGKLPNMVVIKSDSRPIIADRTEFPGAANKKI